MSKSTILAINEVAENQNNKHITINEAIAALEEANNSRLSVDMTAGDTTLVDTQLTRYFIFECTNINSAGVALKIPYLVGGSNPTKRFFAVRNSSAYDVVVETSNAILGSVVTVLSGTTSFLYAEGSDITSMGSIGSGIPFTFAAYIPGLPPAGAVEVYRLIFVEDVSFADNFTGSQGTQAVDATSDSAFVVNKNGTPIGTVTYKTDGTSVFATSGSGNEYYNAGDILTVLSPVVQDATLSGVSMTFKGNRL